MKEVTEHLVTVIQVSIHELEGSGKHVLVMKGAPHVLCIHRLYLLHYVFTVYTCV